MGIHFRSLLAAQRRKAREINGEQLQLTAVREKEGVRIDNAD